MKRKLLLQFLAVIAALSLNGCAFLNPIGLARVVTGTAFSAAATTVNMLTSTAVSTARTAIRTGARLAPYAASAALLP